MKLYLISNCWIHIAKSPKDLAIQYNNISKDWKNPYTYVFVDKEKWNTDKDKHFIGYLCCTYATVNGGLFTDKLYVKEFKFDSGKAIHIATIIDSIGNIEEHMKEWDSD